MNKDDVVTVSKQLSFVGASTFTVEEAGAKLADFVENRASIAAQVWKGDGVRCRVLQVGDGRWKEGKVRISLEFIPDEEEIVLEQQAELVEEMEPKETLPLKQLESPLDEFRVKRRIKI
ncbi:MAG: KGK domain-containing protein [Hassallia sp.]